LPPKHACLRNPINERFVVDVHSAQLRALHDQIVYALDVNRDCLNLVFHIASPEKTPAAVLGIFGGRSPPGLVSSMAQVEICAQFWLAVKHNFGCFPPKDSVLRRNEQAS